ncbi:hypothetical protein EHJ11_14950 [Cronobacter turicensis]|nr:hypothetical protein [Cronobacter turicensis]
MIRLLWRQAPYIEAIAKLINPLIHHQARFTLLPVAESSGFIVQMRYSTTEVRSNVKQFCCQICESVTLYLIKFVTQLY